MTNTTNFDYGDFINIKDFIYKKQGVSSLSDINHFEILLITYS